METQAGAAGPPVLGPMQVATVTLLRHARSALRYFDMHRRGRGSDSLDSQIPIDRFYHMNRSPIRRIFPGFVPPSIALVALVVAIASSCGDSKPRPVNMRACAPEDSATWLAVLAYVKASSPYPQRFLSPSGTDSSLPDIGVLALQEKGPTYFFPPDSAQRLKVRKKMLDVGPYTTLLVAWHGSRRETDTSLVVRLGGTYIGGPHDAEPGIPRAFRFGCDNGRWRLRATTEEKKS